jgi:hypothetical protein
VGVLRGHRLHSPETKCHGGAHGVLLDQLSGYKVQNVLNGTSHSPFAWHSNSIKWHLQTCKFCKILCLQFHSNGILRFSGMLFR